LIGLVEYRFYSSEKTFCFTANIWHNHWPYAFLNQTKHMKIYKFILTVVVAASVMAFKGKDGVFKVDAEKSKLTWIGKKVTGSHNGTINIAEGSLTTKSDKVTGGTFTIDMTSIKDADGNERLVGHLKSDDFFSTEKHPKATFVISKVTAGEKDQYTVKGNLTIKGITNEVEFPATVQVVNGQITAKAKILVDRTKFDIKFRSGNFFENLGDKAIEDNFELNVELVGTQGV
jgi:polyisoprenoid-binding protein YceI